MKKLLKRYEELARIHASIDYGNSRSIKRANDAVDEMISMSRKVSLMGEGGLEAFATLLDVSANKVCLWAAHHILEHMDFNKSLEQRALGIIQGYAEGESAKAFGERLWLTEWEEKHKQGVNAPGAAAQQRHAPDRE